jgi:hypothetical protein
MPIPPSAVTEFTSGRRRDGAHSLDAEDARKLEVRAQPLTHREIQAIEPARPHADQDLSRTWNRDRTLLDLQNIHTAWLQGHGSFHGGGGEWGASHPDVPWVSLRGVKE